MQTKLDDPEGSAGLSENELPQGAQAEPESASAPAGPREEGGGRDSLLIFAGLAALSVFLLVLFGGVVFYLNTSQSEGGESCVIDASVHCVTWRLSASGRLELKLANGHASTLYFDGAACSDDPLFDGKNASLERAAAVAGSGEAAELALTCRGAGGALAAGLPGEAFEGRLFVSYHLAGEPAGSRGVVGWLKTRRA